MRIYRGTTGDVRIAERLSRYDIDGETSLEVSFFRGMDRDQIQVLDGAAIVSDVPILPADTLIARLVEAIEQHRAAHPQPAPAAATESAAPAAPVKDHEEVRQIRISDIGHFPGGNVRQNFARLEELAEDIKRRGIRQPLIVNEHEGQYTLLSGERRLRAAGLAGLPTVPCLLEHMSDVEALEWMLVENIQREDLNPMEEARAYQRLLAIHGDQGAVARAVGKSRPHVAEYLQLLQLPANLQHQVETGTIAVKAGLDYLRSTRDASEPVRERIAQRMTEEQPSVRETPKLIKQELESASVARATRPTQQPAATREAATPSPAVVATVPGAALPVSPPVPAAPRVNPETERARQLVAIGRKLWRGGPRHGSTAGGQVLFSRECYLPLERVLKHWVLRQDLGANHIPKACGDMEIDIPEQRVWIRYSEPYQDALTEAFKIDGIKLLVQTAMSRIEAVYTGNPVYYRTAMLKAEHGGHKSLVQQVVIQDGGRHIVINGSGTAMIRADLVPKLADLVGCLPGLPEGLGMVELANDHASLLGAGKPAGEDLEVVR